MIKRIFLSVFTLVFLSLVSSFGAVAQDGDTRASTGGAQTLEDILNRQSGQKIDDTFRSDATVIQTRRLRLHRNWVPWGAFPTLKFIAHSVMERRT